MRFLITASPAKNAKPHDSNAPIDEKVIAAYMKFNEDMTRAGVLIAAEGLRPGGAHAQITVKDGKRVLTDGPYTETKELLGGLYLIQVKSKEEAIAWALRCPVGLSHNEVLELHQMTELSDLPPRMQEIIGEAAPTWSSKLWRSAA